MAKKDIVNSLKIFLCCVGTVIGAGFASGQEIMSFFVKYGESGAVGMALCGVLFFAYVYVVLKKIYIYSISDFGGYFSGVAGKGTVTLIEWISYAFMLASFVVMVSGSGAVAEELFGRNTVGILFMAILCFGVFLKGVDGLVAVNAVMTPLIIVGIIAVGVMSLFAERNVFLDFNISAITDNFAVSSLLYVSYNTITLIGVLLPLKDKVTSKSTVLLSALFSGGLLLLAGIILWAVMCMYKSNLSNVQVPMLYIAGNCGVIVKYLYAAVLYMAMITTAVSSGFAFLSFLNEKAHIKMSKSALIICLLSVPLSYIGFASLVGKLYKFFGFLGLFILVLVLADGAVEWVRKK